MCCVSDLPFGRFVLYRQAYLRDDGAFGAVTFTAPNHYSVDTSSLSYCSSSVAACTILTPTEALLSGKSSMNPSLIWTQPSPPFHKCISKQSFKLVLFSDFVFFVPWIPIDSVPGALFVNTRVTYTSESCVACSHSSYPWLSTPTSVSTILFIFSFVKISKKKFLSFFHLSFPFLRATCLHNPLIHHM